MKAPMEISRPRGIDELKKTGTSPATTVSTDALRVGLAHLIHEITNPLQLIYNTAHLMELRLPAVNGCRDPLMVEMLEQGKHEIERLTSLLQSLRSELESLWQIKPSFERLNLGTLLDEMLQREALGLAASGIFLSREIGTDLPLIQGNKKLLEVAFSNLLKNASAAMPEGGEIRVEVAKEQHSIHIEISDSGVGIPLDLNVFQPFATSKPRGMGLGLVITRHIVASHSGTITYESQPRKGTTFLIDFPLKAEPQNVSVPPSEELYGCLCHAPLSDLSIPNKGVEGGGGRE